MFNSIFNKQPKNIWRLTLSQCVWSVWYVSYIYVYIVSFGHWCIEIIVLLYHQISSVPQCPLGPLWLLALHDVKSAPWFKGITGSVIQCSPLPLSFPVWFPSTACIFSESFPDSLNKYCFLWASLTLKANILLSHFCIPTKSDSEVWIWVEVDYLGTDVKKPWWERGIGRKGEIKGPLSSMLARWETGVESLWEAVGNGMEHMTQRFCHTYPQEGEGWTQSLIKSWL